MSRVDALRDAFAHEHGPVGSYAEVFAAELAEIIEVARQEGRDEGAIKGLAEGIAKGREEERARCREIAVGLVERGLTAIGRGHGLARDVAKALATPPPTEPAKFVEEVRSFTEAEHAALKARHRKLVTRIGDEPAKVELGQDFNPVLEAARAILDPEGDGVAWNLDLALALRQALADFDAEGGRG